MISSATLAYLFDCFPITSLRLFRPFVTRLNLRLIPLDDRFSIPVMFDVPAGWPTATCLYTTPQWHPNTTASAMRPFRYRTRLPTMTIPVPSAMISITTPCTCTIICHDFLLRPNIPDPSSNIYRDAHSDNPSDQCTKRQCALPMHIKYFCFFFWQVRQIMHMLPTTSFYPSDHIVLRPLPEPLAIAPFHQPT